MLNAKVESAHAYLNFKGIHIRHVDLNVSSVLNVQEIEHVYEIDVLILVLELVARMQYALL